MTHKIVWNHELLVATLASHKKVGESIRNNLVSV